MKLRHLKISRFRGIKSLDWTVGGQFVCFVGPGDSGKSTVLDALELVLSPRWNVPFDDMDFYNADTSEEVDIIVTISDPPHDLISYARYGLDIRGWTKQDTIRDEPDNDDEPAISIRLKVDASLEPSWTVFTERNPEGKAIGARDRERLGCTRLGAYLDRHFTWGKGAILSRLTGEADDLALLLADAGRAARMAFAETPSENVARLKEAADSAQLAGRKFGVASFTGYRPHVDVQAIAIGNGGLSLHDGNIPLRRAGLGTRRLLAVAMQHQTLGAQFITLIDEVEQGLEPHRLRHLLRQLCDGPALTNHVFMTTHAALVLEELKTQHLRIVRRSRDGRTEVLPVPSVLQPVVIRASGAFLARKIIVCEGKTEIGFCRRFDTWWSAGGLSFGFAGIALIDGGGSQAPETAKAMADLGYSVALFGDSDCPINPTEDQLRNAGVEVILWSEGMAIEQRLTADLPWHAVVNLVELAMSRYEGSIVPDTVHSKLPSGSPRFQGPPSTWLSLGISEAQLRTAIGLAAKNKNWFKRVALAIEAADIVVRHSDDVRNNDLGRKIETLRLWASRDE